jgi:pilus assembly protein Flp/PilA
VIVAPVERSYPQFKPEAAQRRLGSSENRRTDMMNLKNLLKNLATDESGQDLIEYALVAALVGLGAVASMKTLSTAIGTAFGTIGTTLTSNV